LNWQTVKLNEVAMIQMGQSPPGDTYNMEGVGLPFFQGKTDFGEKYPSIRMYCNAPNRIAISGDILLSVRAPVGPTNVADRECCIGRGLAAIRSMDENIITPSFLQYVFKWIEPSLTRSGQGSTFKAVKRSDVEDIEFPLPPLSEQHRVVDILDQAGALRKLRNKADTLAAAILPALFYKMFGDPISNSGEWPKKSFEEVCTKISDGTHHSPKPQSNGVKYVTAKHVRPYIVDFKSAPTYVQMNDHKKIYSRCDPVKGDILYIKDGVTTGAAAINPFDEEFSMLSSLALLRCNDSLITPEYFVSFLNMPSIKKRMTGNMDGAAIRRLTLTKIKSSIVPVPSMELQHDFSSRYWIIQSQDNQNKSVKEHIDRLYAILMHKAFKGFLTQKWRVAHMEELLQEMDEQARLLGRK